MTAVIHTAAYLIYLDVLRWAGAARGPTHLDHVPIVDTPRSLR
jgi:hypothetical protein